ncbi:MAG: hypothetical protein HY258_04875 [Chloroflexi bacterium]|nr:hypothetical protein [Chloroflexota bacterium]
MSEEYGSAFERDFFPNAKIVHLEVDVLNDLWADLQKEFAENEWSETDGLRHILAAGLAYLRAERMRQEVADGADSEPRLEQIMHESMEMQGRFALMKYRAYQFLQDAKTLSMKLNACRQESDGLSQEIENLRDKLKGIS